MQIIESVKMDYSKLSDFEIDQLVTANEYNLKGWEFNEAGGFFYHCGPDGRVYFDQPVLKFCSDWSIAGPIIIDNRISVSPQSDGDEWEAMQGLDSDLQPIHSEWDKNPLRAAMIVFLMMKE